MDIIAAQLLPGRSLRGLRGSSGRPMPFLSTEYFKPAEREFPAGWLALGSLFFSFFLFAPVTETIANHFARGFQSGPDGRLPLKSLVYAASSNYPFRASLNRPSGLASDVILVLSSRRLPSRTGLPRSFALILDVVCLCILFFFAALAHPFLSDTILQWLMVYAFS